MPNPSILLLLSEFTVRLNRRREILACQTLGEASQDMQRQIQSLIGQKTDDILPPYMADEVSKNLLQTLNTGQIQVHEYVIDTEDGRYFLEGHFIPLEKDELLIVCHNITGQKQAKLTLQENEERFRTLMETTATSIFVYSGEKFIYANHATQELTGYSIEEFLTLRFWELIHPDYRDLIRQRGLARQRGEKIPSRYEFKIIRKNGEERWVDFTAGRIQWKGKPAAIGSAIDITERKEAELALQHSEDRYRDLVENSPIIIGTHDLEGNLLSVNPAAAALSGYTRDELLGMNLRDILAPATRHHLQNYLAEIEKKGQISGLMVVLTKNGEERVLSYVNSLRTKGISAPIVRSIAHDITQQRQAEKALRESEERFRTYIERANDYIFTLDLQGRITFVNQAMRLALGYQNQELIGRPATQIVAPEAHEKALQTLQRIWKGETVETMDIPVRTKDGHTLWIRIKGRSFYRNGKIIETLHIARDITEARRRERMLEAKAMLTQAQAETLDTDTLLQRILAAARHLIPAAEKGSLALLLDEKKLQVKAVYGYPENKLEGYTIAVTGCPQRLIQARKPLLVHAVEKDPECQAQLARALPQSAHSLQSLLAAPLQGRTSVIGILALQSRRPNAFSAEDLPILTDFTASAALLIENAQLFANEHHQRQIAEQLSQALSASAELTSLLEPDLILERLLASIEQVIPFDGANIMLIAEGDGTAHITHVRGYQNAPDLANKIKGMRLALAATPNLRWIYENKKHLVIQDIADDPAWIHIEGAIARSWIGAPIIINKQVVAIFSLDSKKPGFFTEEHGLLLKAFAGQASLALQNARLFEETRRRAEETASLLDASLAISHLDLQETLQTIGQRAQALFLADGCHIYLRSQDKQRLCLKLTLGENDTSNETAIIHAGEGIIGAIAASGQAEIINDTSRDSRSRSQTTERKKPKAIMLAPLKSGEESVGVISVQREGIERPFQPSDLELLRAFASLSASAVANARLYNNASLRLERLSALRKIARAISNSFDLKTTLETLLSQIQNQLKIDAAAVYLYDSDTHTLSFAHGLGFRSAAFQHIEFPLGQGYTGQVAHQRQPIHIPDLSQRKNSRQREAYQRIFSLEGFKTYYGMPLVAKGNLVGVLEVFHRSTMQTSSEWLDFLHALAGEAAIAIDNIALFNRLQRTNVMLEQTYDATIEGWAHALELKDTETTNHSRRVVAMTLKIAQKMGISDQDLVHIRRGALLHDIGKMAIPDAILLKPGPLTPEEWAIMQQHPVHAYRMLYPIAYLRPALNIPYCHHERWNGSGYPRGLKGKEIPIEARIFAIADVWDALRAERPYRGSWSKEKTSAYLKAQAGKLFDPEIVKVFLSLINHDNDD